MQYFQVLIQFMSIMQFVESQFPDSPGKQKFDIAFQLAEAALGSLQQYAPQLAEFATLMVRIWKAVGVFKSAATPAKV